MNSIIPISADEAVVSKSTTLSAMPNPTMLLYYTDVLGTKQHLTLLDILTIKLDNQSIMITAQDTADKTLIKININDVCNVYPQTEYSVKFINALFDIRQSDCTAIEAYEAIVKVFCEFNESKHTNTDLTFINNSYTEKTSKLIEKLEIMKNVDYQAFDPYNKDVVRGIKLMMDSFINVINNKQMEFNKLDNLTIRDILLDALNATPSVKTTWKDITQLTDTINELRKELRDVSG